MASVQSSMESSLPGSEVTACEWEWTVRALHYSPGATTPRRMYMAACDTGTATPRMFTSLTLGDNAPHPEDDPSSGGIVVSRLDAATGAMVTEARAHFPECISMHGIAASDDCSTVAALCRIPSGTAGFDKDVLSTHRDADWMTQPHVCGDRGLNDEMWLYEWKDGDVTQTPDRYIVHKAIGSWEYGNNYLLMGDDNTYGIAVKATVGGAQGPDTCHEADAFLVLDRSDYSMTTRAWSWACGTGHTTFNRPAYDATQQKYAMLCSTDYNEAGTGGLGAFYFRMEDGPASEFHYLNQDALRNKGGASVLLPADGGGFVGLIVGVDGQVSPEGYPERPATGIGLVRWSADGQQLSDIRWVRQDADTYLGYPNLARLGADRYLLGWGEMKRLDDPGDTTDNSFRVPWVFHVMEINGQGDALTQPLTLQSSGWGEQDQMVPLGEGRVGWTYIPRPALDSDGNPPDCNQPSLQMTVYSASGT